MVVKASSTDDSLLAIDKSKAISPITVTFVEK